MRFRRYGTAASSPMATMMAMVALRLHPRSPVLMSPMGMYSANIATANGVTVYFDHIAAARPRSPTTRCAFVARFGKSHR